MFQGRMITVDGCARRMQPNWNCYVINTDTDRATVLKQERWMYQPDQQVEAEPSNVMNSVMIPVEPGKVYNIKLSNTNNQVYVVGLDSSKAVKDTKNWQNSGYNYTASENIYWLAMTIAVGEAHTAQLTVGDCGIVVKQVR